MPRSHHEDDKQETFFEWVSYKRHEGIPLNDLCFAIPNGGKRNAREAARLKKQGVKAGVSDVFLAVPRHGYAGLWIEFKHGDNKLSKDQEKFKKNMLKMGYLHVTCYSFDGAQIEVETYLKNNDKPKAYISELSGKFKYMAVCRRSKKPFTRKAYAINWLKRRGFNEHGERI